MAYNDDIDALFDYVNNRNKSKYSGKTSSKKVAEKRAPQNAVEYSKQKAEQNRKTTNKTTLASSRNSHSTARKTSSTRNKKQGLLYRVIKNTVVVIRALKSNKKLNKAEKEAVESFKANMMCGGVLFLAGTIVGFSLANYNPSGQVSSGYNTYDESNIGIEASGEMESQKALEDILNASNEMDSREESYEKVYMGHWAGSPCEFVDERYALELAENAINKVNATLSNLEPVQKGSKDFLPEYFDEYLLAGLMRQESGLRTQVVSGVGAKGLCQVRADYAMADVNTWFKEMGIDFQYDPAEIYDPEVNVEVSAFYQALMLHKYFRNEYNPSVQKAKMLMGYNVGPTKIKNMDTSEFIDKYYNDEGSYFGKVTTFANRYEEKYKSVELQL